MEPTPPQAFRLPPPPARGRRARSRLRDSAGFAPASPVDGSRYRRPSHGEPHDVKVTLTSRRDLAPDRGIPDPRAGHGTWSDAATKVSTMDMRWRWDLHGADGSVLPADPATGEPTPSFPTQSDAESWIGQEWPVLLDSGVAAVTLFEEGTVVYGPMPLTPLS